MYVIIPHDDAHWSCIIIVSEILNAFSLKNYFDLDFLLLLYLDIAIICLLCSVNFVFKRKFTILIWSNCTIVRKVIFLVFIKIIYMKYLARRLKNLYSKYVSLQLVLKVHRDVWAKLEWIYGKYTFKENKRRGWEKELNSNKKKIAGKHI